MKITLIFLLIFLPLSKTVAGDHSLKYDVQELRSLYQKASEDSRVGKLFYSLMCDYEGKEPVVLAYKAAAEAIEAKYTSTVFSKLKHLKASVRLFEQAVKLSSNDPEIRFLRYTVEQNLPGYLNMSEHLQEDKNVIMASLKNISDSGTSAVWVQTVCEVMLSLGYCTEEETKELRHYKSMLVAGAH